MFVVPVFRGQFPFDCPYRVPRHSRQRTHVRMCEDPVQQLMIDWDAPFYGRRRRCTDRCPRTIAGEEQNKHDGKAKCDKKLKLKLKNKTDIEKKKKGGPKTVFEAMEQEFEPFDSIFRNFNRFWFDSDENMEDEKSTSDEREDRENESEETNNDTDTQEKTEQTESEQTKTEIASLENAEDCEAKDHTSNPGPKDIVTASEETESANIDTIEDNSAKLLAKFDLSRFKPEEISVKVKDGQVSVEAKHEVKDDTAMEFYYFNRSFTLPKDVDPMSLVSTMNEQGTLAIEGVKLPAIEGPPERVLAIRHE